MSTVLSHPAGQALNLADYDVSPARGFLADFEPAALRPAPFLQPVCDAAVSLPELLSTGQIRKHLSELPPLDLTDFCASR